MATAADIQPGDVVLEVGPGLGHLTHVLAERGAQVAAVELDHELAARLRNEFRDTQVQILQGDFLSRGPRDWLNLAGLEPARYKVVANLPYYITSAILRHLLEADLPPSQLALLVQREVARQIVARPPRLSLLAVSVQFFADPRIVAVVPAGAFYPRPKVDSAIVALAVKRRAAGVDPSRFFEIVRAGFGARRKQLLNSLAAGLGMEPRAVARSLVRARIQPTRRAETLALEEWLALYSALAG